MHTLHWELALLITNTLVRIFSLAFFLRVVFFFFEDRNALNDSVSLDNCILRTLMPKDIQFYLLNPCDHRASKHHMWGKKE